MSLQIFVFDRIHDVVVADHRAGNHHGAEDNRKDGSDTSPDCPPGQGEGNIPLTDHDDNQV